MTLLTVTTAMAYISAAILVVWIIGEWRNSKLLWQIERFLERAQEAHVLIQRVAGMLAASKIDEAVSLFKSGCPCSRVLLSTYGPTLCLSRGEALEAGLRFARLVNVTKTCGVVTGAFTILTARNPIGCPNTRNGQSDARAALANFSNRFKAKYGTITCRELLGRDAHRRRNMDPTQRNEATRSPVCLRVVHDAAELLEDMLNPEHQHDARGLRIAA